MDTVGPSHPTNLIRPHCGKRKELQGSRGLSLVHLGKSCKNDRHWRKIFIMTGSHHPTPSIAPALVRQLWAHITAWSPISPHESNQVFKLDKTQFCNQYHHLFLFLSFSLFRQVLEFPWSNLYPTAHSASFSLIALHHPTTPVLIPDVSVLVPLFSIPQKITNQIPQVLLSTPLYQFSVRSAQCHQMPYHDHPVAFNEA